MIKLVKPIKYYFDKLNNLKLDFINNGEKRIQGSGAIEKYNDLNDWLNSIDEIEQGKNDCMVPTTYYLIITENEVVGTICIRHFLSKELEEFGGHIGYSVKPSARNKGYAKEALKILLNMYKEKFEYILIMCEDDNIASNKIIVSNGGVLINQVDKFHLKINRYKIKDLSYKYE